MGLFGKRSTYFKEKEINEETNSKMGTKITQSFEHMKHFSSQYLTIVTFAGIILGGYKVYDQWSDSNDDMKEKFEIIMSSQKDEKRLDSLLLKGQHDLKKELDDHLKNSEEHTKQLESLQKSYIRYISNDDALTKTDFLKYMEGLSVEEKKNSSGSKMMMK